MDALTQAREQIEGITFAINREKLILETSQKDNEIAIKAIADQSAKLDDLNKQIETAEFALKATNEQIEDAKKDDFKPSKDEERIQKDIVSGHLEVTPSQVVSLGMLAFIFTVIAGLLLTVAIYLFSGAFSFAKYGP